MFAGIVEASCSILGIEESQGSLRLVVDLSPLTGLKDDSGGKLTSLGSSVAVNGVCLTVSKLEGEEATFDVVTETLDCSTLGAFAAGDRVNIERALCFGERIDGHLVQGHVLCTGEVAAVTPQEGQVWLEVSNSEVASRLSLKGSVAVDGVSLTVADLTSEGFAVALVPHTLERTILDNLAVGDLVNLEPDLVGQWVAERIQEVMEEDPPIED